jgi:enoyl-CoA hydratase/carnithine racemase
MSCLSVEEQGRIVWLTLNRPEAANALSRQLIAELRDELARQSQRPELLALVLTGKGDKVFCAGADLKERRTMSSDEVRAHLDNQSALMNEVAAFPRPVLAALNGAALGGGLELALACDLRVAVEGAQLGLPEVRLGIIPAAGGTQRLARVCGLAMAKELILTGRRVSAAAAPSGLINRVVKLDGLRAAVDEILAEIAQAAPLALAEAKRAVDRGWDQEIEAGLALERQCYERLLDTQDRQEGLRAFAEKRPPKYQGR